MARTWRRYARDLGALAVCLTVALGVDQAGAEHNSPSPPLGPPVAAATADSSLSLNWLRGLIEGQVDAVLADIGGVDWVEGGRPTECGHDCVQVPVLAATERHDRPNERIVQFDGSLEFQGSRFGSGRTIAIDFRVRAFCGGRQDGSGTIRLFVDVEAPKITGGGAWWEVLVDFLTDFLIHTDISDRIDAAVLSSIPPLGDEIIDTPFECRSLGLRHDGGPQNDAITWDAPQQTSIIPHSPSDRSI